MTHALEARGLAKTYRRLLGPAQPALQGVDLIVPKGSAFGLIGPNGAGKTTFIKIALGLTLPNGGEVRVLGGAPSDPAIRQRIGYLPERLDLPAVWTPRQFLRSVARLKGIAPAQAKIESWLERVGLSAEANRSIEGFSKGMRQRVGLVAALLGEPELLVLDEPTDGLDPLARVEVREMLFDAKSRGATLFLNSHLLAETERICEQVAILSKGRVVQMGAVSALRAARGGFRLRFQEFERGALVQLGFQPSAPEGVFAFEGDVAALNLALDGARRGGATLIELAPNAPDLEAVFAEALGT